MQVTELKTDGLEREFRIAVPAADIEQRIASRLKELAKTVKMPGFRPGKVPVALLRNRYGPAVLNEALEQTLTESTRSVLSERGLRPAVQPKIEIVSAVGSGSDLEYTMAVELLPEVAPVDYGKIALERLVAEPSEADVEAMLVRLAETFKSSKPIQENRAALPGDAVVIDYVGRVDGDVFDGGSAEQFELELGTETFIPGFEDQLVGARPGEDRQVVVTFPEQFPAQHLAAKEATFDVHVHEIRETSPSPIDDDFAVKLGLESLDAVRQQIRESKRRELRQAARMRLKRALLDALADQYTFDVPKGMVEREFNSVVSQLKSDEDVERDEDSGAAHEHDHEHDHEHGGEHDHDHDHAPLDPARDAAAGLGEEKAAEYRAIAERRVRLGLVLAEVGRANNLQVTQEELSRAIAAEAKRFPGQERKVYDYFQNNPGARESLAGPILEDKVVDFMLEMGTVTDRPVSPEELLNAEEESEAAGTIAASQEGGARGEREPDAAGGAG